MPEPGREAVGAASPETARSAFASPMASTLYAAGVVTRPRRKLAKDTFVCRKRKLSSSISDSQHLPLTAKDLGESLGAMKFLVVQLLPR